MRGENTNRSTRRAQLAQNAANTSRFSRGPATCPAAILQIGARDRYSTVVKVVYTHTRAPLCSCHAKGTVVPPLGAQTRLFHLANSNMPSHPISSHIIRSGGQPASAQHISSHALVARVVSSPIPVNQAYHRFTALLLLIIP
jgi:hypothetical protein